MKTPYESLKDRGRILFETTGKGILGKNCTVYVAAVPAGLRVGIVTPLGNECSVPIEERHAIQLRDVLNKCLPRQEET